MSLADADRVASMVRRLAKAYFIRCLLFVKP